MTYTGRGDSGTTDLHDMTRVSKTHPRIEAAGTIDELNTLLGQLLPTPYLDITDCLTTIQNHLHIIQSRLTTPQPATTANTPTLPDEAIKTLETWIDEYTASLPALDSFILPGGSEAASHCHHARAVCRRAERRLVAVIEASDTTDATTDIDTDTNAKTETETETETTADADSNADSTTADADSTQSLQQLLTYLNRLSDLLFAIARTLNARDDRTERTPSY